MIAFVSIGRTPAYLRVALRQARESNPDLPVVLLHDHDRRLSDWRDFATAHRIELYDIAPLAEDWRLSDFYRRADARPAFWRHTSGRFFILRAFLEREGVGGLTHLENDVLLYAPLTELRRAAPFGDGRLATVFESGARAIPGIVEVGARAALDAFLDFVLSEDQAHPSNDMERFAAFRRAWPQQVKDLPTLPPTSPAARDTASLFASETPVPLPEGGWLFDGARFGQYLGGIDARHAGPWFLPWRRRPQGRLDQPNGFVNESCADDPSRYAYHVARPRGLAVPAVVQGESTFPLATLHVHSKNLDRFCSHALEPLCPRA